MNEYLVSDLTQKIQSFCEERDWNQFHNPKDLAIGMSTESNELLDLFRFKNEQDIKEIMENPETRVRVEEEFADVLFFVLRFAERNGIDVKEALEMKIAKNAKKYPVEKAKGKNLKYDRL